MKLHLLLIIGFALCVTGCSSKEPAVEPVTAEDPATEEKRFYYDGIVKHMHAHADQLDRINIALAEDDLETAKLPARWLSRHDTMSDVPTDWQPYLANMREAAHALEDAADLETARAASKRITVQCQGCHVDAGIFGNGVAQEAD
jgi:hypothetical protein